MTSTITAPVVAAPGSTVNGTISCTNGGPAAATAVTCTPSTSTVGATLTPGACTINGNPATLPVASLSNAAPNNVIVCAFTVSVPANPANSDVGPTTIALAGTTSAGNETLAAAANNGSVGAINIIDAVNDPLLSAGSLLGGATASVLGNDQVGTVTANAAAVGGNVVLTTNGAQGFTGTGVASPLVLNLTTGVITVPANATPGVYTVPYTICSTVLTTVCDSAVATVTVIGAPAISLTKIAGVPTVSLGTDPNRTDVGDTIAYSFSVTNIGTVDLTNVTVSDPKLPALTCAPIATLAAGATQSVVCSSGNVYTLTLADINTGSAINVATATGTAPSSSCAAAPCTVTGTSTSTVPTETNGGISVTKLASPGVFTAVGNVISYTLIIDNTGSSALANVIVTDPKAGAVSCPGGSNVIATLAVNASVGCTASYTITATDVTAGSMTNVARATGTAPPTSCATPPCTVTGTGTTTVVTPTSAPQISVVKQASPKTVSTVGELIDYTLVATNTGNVTLSGVSITDPKLPTLICSPTAPATLAVGAYMRCSGSYALKTAEAAAGFVTNVATAVGTAPSGAPVRGTGTATTPVIPVANDDFGTTTLNTSVITPVSLNDQYPIGSTVATSGASTNGGTVSCTPATPASCTYTPPTGFVGVDTYTYRLCLPSPNQAVCDTAIVTITIGSTTADLAVQKNGPASVQAGGEMVYTITLINNGLSAANGATFTDTLPLGLTGVTAFCTGTGGSGTSACTAITLAQVGNSINGTIPSFPSGGSVLITIRGTAPATGPVVNTVTISTPVGVTDSNPANNTSSVTTRIGTPPLEADLAVIKAGPAATSPSNIIRYVIDVVNGGPGAANGAVFRDNVPATITGVTWTCSSSGQATCPAASGAGNAIAQTILAMPMNGRLRYVVTGTVAANSTGTIVNTATVTPPQGVIDPDLSNNSSTVTTTVATTGLTTANLSMSKIGPSTVVAGGLVSYTMVATNNGPSAANGAVVTDIFPAVLFNVAWTCSASAGASCGSASGTGNLSLTLPTFASGSQVTIRVTGNAPSSGTFQNSSRVFAPPTVIDSDPSDDIGGPVITTVLLAPADLVTTVTIGAPGNVGQPITAIVTMGNIGPSPAGNVTVTLQLPVGSTAVNPTGGGVYNPSTGVVTWPVIAFVPANTNPVASYAVTFVPPSSGGTLRSDVVTPDPEVTLTNNPATVSLQVLGAPQEPASIPTTPWWLLALGLTFFAGRRLMADGVRSDRRG